MDIKYVLARRTDGPDEITDITIKSDFIPRKGELVDISVRVAEGEYLAVMGRVTDVIWYIKDKDSHVCVFLGA